ncbi:hypothetical protein MCOR12_010497 [Pyricularia oryzae]|nr:hypothetical protein MCOR12_010497 [Pyricularia oryzae]
MSARHFVNDPTHLVNTALHAITITNPSVACDAENKIIYVRPDSRRPRQPVAIISGGGSGHEPSFGGMVGRGLLSAAVAGTIFASPSTEQVRTAITSRVEVGARADGGGVLITVMNYTGDILNFGVAAEKARAAGINVEMVVIGDDVGVGRAKGGKVGRRGIAGTVLVDKIAGALAARGANLSEVTHVARLVASNVASIGASLEHVHVPGRKAADQEDTLAEGEVEIGMGIHNEPGSGREKDLELPALVERMLAQLLDQKDADRAYTQVGSGDKFVLLVNNLGGVSVLEMGGITAEVAKQLGTTWAIKPVRVLAGTFMTSLNGLGFSISLLKVVDTGSSATMVQLLDDPCEATGWSAPIATETWDSPPTATKEGNLKEERDLKPTGLRLDAAVAQNAITAALENVIAVEPEVTKYDTVVGDGDCGIGLRRGAEAVLKHLASNPLSGDAAVDVASIVPVVENHMDGTSGALYSIFLNAMLRSLRDNAPSSGESTASPELWAKVLKESCKALGNYSQAQVGDRTLIDALHPFVNTLAETGNVGTAASAAQKGAESTKGMKPSFGRSTYVGGTGFEQVPDAGAWRLAAFFNGLARQS